MFDKGANIIQWGKEVLQMVVEQVGINMGGKSDP